jgi:hypothetical protein
MNEGQGTPYITREYCTCNIDPGGHYHYDRDIWIAWFNLTGRKPSFLAMRDHIKRATEGKLNHAPASN